MKNGIKLLISWLQKDISLKKKGKKKRLSSKKQYQLIQLLHNLQASGFNLVEMVSFLKKSKLISEEQVKIMEFHMLNGSSLSKIMLDLGYPDSIITQLSLAELHGNILGSLENIETYLLQVNHIKKKTFEVVMYPLVLLFFLTTILLGLRQYLLPSLNEEGPLMFLLTYFPHLLIILIVIILFVSIVVIYKWRHSSPLKLISQISRLPLIGYVIQLYMTAFYAREWGNLLDQGLELSTILSVMSKEKSLLVREIGIEMNSAFVEGIPFEKKVLDYPFFKNELSLIISYGQVKSKLGKELEIYSQNTWESYFRFLIQLTQLIQPIVFLAVALIIVMIYAAMLLPIYQNMGGNL
ncbi:competence type IV pilus assembly protein ComGB [Streptococcus parauberis]|uniref:competence type IV pilus assembly protein ComGB n=1 Tax=Streptococcus parauberis TaxID=1348 RepID=UPI00020CBD08|nr:competence type IV pilus assembly protein ComGB [Streptococcus parauberis]AEF26060.1 competence protein [Streptococcus parauberis KCTC 11537]UWM90951.1 competence type IV pilus assembly protein ComGB [Streptococcus parauberis]WEM63043.1 competence type IV pilus assembly protein ComGB [Streptococcus parauberis]